ncbi:MAG: Gfo/Idh/MocA family oxidoreductase [Limisphaerales bacterium]
MKFTIFGSGFGLYGYLPALVTGCDQTVYLPERYRTLLERREDVRRFIDVVKWSHDEKAALAEVDAVVISKRPADQVDWIRECASKPNIRALLLEKPLAPSPKAASDALGLLDLSGKQYRIDYNFRFTPWGQALKRHLRSALPTGCLSINWQFRAHHYAHDLRNWKRFVSSGGGALRFFGIHLIGLLAELGFDNVVSSRVSASKPDECEIWSAVFGGPHLPECRVEVQSNAPETRFSVDWTRDASGVERLVDLDDPFGAQANKSGFDHRVGILTEVCRDLIDGPALSYPWYRQSVSLWHMAERLC